MAEEVKVNFYRIHKCGYYQRGASSPEFSGISELFSELQSWAFDGNKPLSETCTYKPDDEGNNLHTYCFALKRMQNGDILFTTWNETETIDGSFASVNGAEPAGNASVSTSSIPANHIPGYPTYFWFIPQKNTFATLRFNQRANGHQGLKMLLSDFLAKFTSFTVYDHLENNDEEVIVGYRKQPTDEPCKLNPVFKSYPARIPGQIEYLKSNREKIKKIIRKNLLLPVNQDDRTFWQKLCNNIGLTSSPQLAGELKIRFEVPLSPSSNELDEIISEWESEEGSSWNNVGFELAGDSEIRWLSHALVKTTIDIEISRDSSNIVLLGSLADAIALHRDTLLGVLE